MAGASQENWANSTVPLPTVKEATATRFGSKSAAVQRLLELAAGACRAVERRQLSNPCTVRTKGNDHTDEVRCRERSAAHRQSEENEDGCPGGSHGLMWSVAGLSLCDVVEDPWGLDRLTIGTSPFKACLLYSTADHLSSSEDASQSARASGLLSRLLPASEERAKLRDTEQ